jgi:transmembrane sensor
MTLNSGTQVRVAIEARTRRIDLEQGEAFFVVAQDASRPFTIRAADKQVVALGTALSVRLTRKADVQVIVTNGRVQLRPSASNSADPGTLLQAGNIARTTDDSVIVQTVSPEETQRLVSWKDGFMIFRNTPLSDAVAEFNRYSTRKLIIADPSIAGIRIGGKFRCNNLEAFVALLQSGFPIAVEESGERILLRRK